MAGLYDIRCRRGVYYEVRVNRMEGVVAIGAFSHAHKSSAFTIAVYTVQY
jgi:hypothetical protein